MSCKPCVFEAVEVTCDGDVITITLEHGVLATVCKNQLFTVSYKSVPQCDRCSRIVVTDGATTKNVAKNNQYFRPRELPCDCDMLLCNKTDPATVAVFCRWVAPRGCS